MRTLYLRCLVPCANYFRFWMRYINFLRTAVGDDNQTRSAFQSAMRSLQTRPNIYLAYAAYEESCGRIDAARAVFQQILGSIAPGLVEGIIRFANFERRQGQHAAALKLLESALATASDKTLPFLSMFTAKYYGLLQRETGLGLPAGTSPMDRSHQILDAALEKFPENFDLWVFAINLETSFGGMTLSSQARVNALYARVLAPSSTISAARKQVLWKDRLAFAADWGNNPMRYWELDTEFQEQFGEFSVASLSAPKAPASAPAPAPHAGTKHPADSDAAGKKKSRTEEEGTPATAPQTPAEQQAAYYAYIQRYYQQQQQAGAYPAGAAAPAPAPPSQ